MNSSIESTNTQIITANQSEIASLESESHELSLAEGKDSEATAIQNHIGQLKSQIATAERNIDQMKDSAGEKAVQEAGKATVKPEEQNKKQEPINTETKDSKKDQKQEKETGLTGGVNTGTKVAGRSAPVISDAA